MLESRLDAEEIETFVAADSESESSFLDLFRELRDLLLLLFDLEEREDRDFRGVALLSLDVS